MVRISAVTISKCDKFHRGAFINQCRREHAKYLVNMPKLVPSIKGMVIRKISKIRINHVSNIRKIIGEETFLRNPFKNFQNIFSLNWSNYEK